MFTFTVWHAVGRLQGVADRQTMTNAPNPPASHVGKASAQSIHPEASGPRRMKAMCWRVGARYKARA